MAEQFIHSFTAPNLDKVPIGPSNEFTGLTIGTHDGKFHCDEAMACGLLRHTQKFGTAQIVRTRDGATLDKCSTVVDVGGVYNHENFRYDHHQKEFVDTMHTGTAQYPTRLSAAGLVYRHYGRELIGSYLSHCAKSGRVQADYQANATKLNEDVEVLYDRMYRDFVEHVDGIDNGVEQFSGDNLKRNYPIPTSLSERISRLYPRWNEDGGREQEDLRFGEAMRLATFEFYENLDFFACSWLPARSIVLDAFNKAKDNHASQAILVFPSGGCPWKEHLVAIEKEQNCLGRSLFALFPDPKGSWRVSTVPKENAAFANRKSLPWRGLRDDDLSKASGIEGGVFVHVAGFIGGNKTFEGALQMAIKAVEMESTE